MTWPADAASTSAPRVPGVAVRSQPGPGVGVGDGLGVGVGDGDGVGVGVGVGALLTATCCVMASEAPFASVTARWTYLVPATLNVNLRVWPVPSGYASVPPGPTSVHV